MVKYELIDHTADIGIRVKGGSLKDLFRNAGLAIFQIIAEKKKIKNTKPHNLAIVQEADNLEELLINWLNELISLSSAKGLIFEDLRIKKINQKRLEAVAVASNINNYKVNTEIKAATYHQLKIAKKAGGWQAEVILDV